MQTDIRDRDYSTETEKSSNFLIKNILEKYNMLV